MRSALLSLLALCLAGCASATPVPSGRVLPGVGADASAPLMLKDMSGVTINVDEELRSDHKVVLVFWQTWCASCIREAPALARAAREHQNLRFVGVISGSDEYVDDEGVRTMAEEMKLPYAQVRDRDLQLATRFGIEGTPTIVVLGKNGVLYRGHRAPDSWTVWGTAEAARSGS